MRGERAIFHTLFNESDTQTEQPTTERKGRSEVLKMRQNEMIVHRFYFYAKIEGYKYERILETLEVEVHLSKRTLVDIVNRNVSLLKSLQNAKPDRKELKTKYPFLNWTSLYQ